MKEIDDKDTFSKRLSRYTQVNLKATGLAGQFILDKLKSNTDPNERAEILYQSLGSLRGPLIKIPQFLGTIPDFLPSAYQEKFLNLQANVPPMGTLFVKRRMRSELGSSWEDLFQHFNLKASFAASLGQVHQGILKNGDSVACKLQYPNMISTVEADLKQFKILLSIYTSFNKTLDTSDIFEEISQHISEELDYENESRNMAIYKAIFKNCFDIIIPSAFSSLTTNRLLTMTWLDGNNVLSYKDGPLEERNSIARTLFKAWYLPLYSYGVLHGDPHIGNYTITSDLKINLLDFGCVRYFSSDVIKGIIELYRSILSNDKDRAYYAYELWGFKNLKKETISILDKWAKFLYGPLLENRVVDIREDFSSESGQKIAAAVLESLKQNGGIKPPKSFVFMDRSAVGMGSVFLHLGAKLNWHQIYEEYLESCYPEKIELKRQAL